MTDLEVMMPVVGEDFDKWGTKWNAMWLIQHDMYGRHRAGVFDNLPAMQPGNEGEIKQTVGGEVVNARHKAHTGITVAAADSPQWLRDMADFHPSLSGSDSAHLQAAIDQANDHPSVDFLGGAPPVLLMPGNHQWDSTVTKKNAAITSLTGGAVGAKVAWVGTPGQTAMVTTDYSNSFGNISGIQFFPGGEGYTNHPGHWIDFSTEVNLLDVFMSLEWCYFAGGTVPIKVGRWWNIHWSHLRFDSWNDVAIELNPGEGQFATSFNLDQFTADNGSLGTAATNRGFMRVVMPEGGDIPHGLVHLSNARIEYNRPLLSGVGGTIICEWPEPSYSDITLSLSNLTIQDQVQSENNHLIYQDSPGGEVNPITSRGSAIYPSGLTANLYNGDLPGWFAGPRLAGNSLNTWQVGGVERSGATKESWSGAGDWILERSYVQTEEEPRHQRDANGTYTWGEGTSLYRGDAGGLVIEGGLHSPGNVSTEGGVSATWGFAAPGGQWYEGHVELGDMHIWRAWNNVPLVGAGEVAGDESGQTFSSVPYSTRVVTASTTLTALDSTILVDATAGAVTITLPGIGTLSDGTTYRIKKIDASANAVTVDGNASETLDGLLSIALESQYDYLEITAGNGNWYLIGRNV